MLLLLCTFCARIFFIIWQSMIRENAIFTFPFITFRLAYPVGPDNSLQILCELVLFRVWNHLLSLMKLSHQQQFRCVGPLHHSHFLISVLISFPFVFYIYSRYSSLHYPCLETNSLDMPNRSSSFSILFSISERFCSSIYKHFSSMLSIFF